MMRKSLIFIIVLLLFLQIPFEQVVLGQSFEPHFIQEGKGDYGNIMKAVSVLTIDAETMEIDEVLNKLEDFHSIGSTKFSRDEIYIKKQNP